MKKTLCLVLLYIGFVGFAYSQSKSGYQIQGTKKSKKGSIENSAFIENMFFGVGPDLGGGQNYLYLSIAPFAGYDVTDWFKAGVGVSYGYSKYFDLKFSDYGTYAFANATFYDGFYASVKFEVDNYEFLNTNYDFERDWYNTVFIGIGSSYSIGDRAEVWMTLYYNVNYDTGVGAINGPYQSPVLITPAFIFRF